MDWAYTTPPSANPNPSLSPTYTSNPVCQPRSFYCCWEITFIIQGTSREHSVNIQGTFSELSSFREHPGNIQWTFRERSVNFHHSRNIQGTFSEHSGNIQGTFSEHSGNVQWTFIIQGTSRTRTAAYDQYMFHPKRTATHFYVVKYTHTSPISVLIVATVYTCTAAYDQYMFHPKRTVSYTRLCCKIYIYVTYQCPDCC
jgi:hypothetical protein